MAKRRKKNARKDRPVSIPKTVTELGRLLELRVERDGKIVKWTWPKRKRGARKPALLLCNPTGRRVYGATFTELAVEEIGERVRTREITKAGRQYTKWSKFRPDQAAVYDVFGGALKFMGHAIALDYQSDKWSGKSQEYTHDFGSLCDVWADRLTNPRAIAVIGGDLRVTDKGIEG